MDVESEIQRMKDELRRERPELNFRDLRAVERSYVRLHEQILVPANRSITAADMIQMSTWPDVSLLPLTIYHHNLIVTWIQREANAAASTSPSIDWQYFSDQ